MKFSIKSLLKLTLFAALLIVACRELGGPTKNISTRKVWHITGTNNHFSWDVYGSKKQKFNIGIKSKDERVYYFGISLWYEY